MCPSGEGGGTLCARARKKETRERREERGERVVFVSSVRSVGGLDPRALLSGRRERPRVLVFVSGFGFVWWVLQRAKARESRSF
jgi:hypothetical protein